MTTMRNYARLNSTLARMMRERFPGASPTSSAWG